MTSNRDKGSSRLHSPPKRRRLPGPHSQPNLLSHLSQDSAGSPLNLLKLRNQHSRPRPVIQQSLQPLRTVADNRETVEMRKKGTTSPPLLSALDQLALF